MAEMKTSYKRLERELRTISIKKVALDNANERLKALELDDGIGAINYDECRTGTTNKISQPVEDLVIKIDQEREALQKYITRLNIRLYQIEKALTILPERERKIIEKRYFVGLQWHEISCNMSICQRHLLRLRDKAFDKMLLMLKLER